MVQHRTVVGSFTVNARGLKMIKRVRKDERPEEPLGIIISRGDTSEPEPRFAAFVWGPVPEPEQGNATTKAA